MNCSLPEEVTKAVISHLRRTRQTVACIGGTNTLIEGIPDLNTIREACQNGAIHITTDGSIKVCGIRIDFDWDTARARRKIEDHLRKSASRQEIIRIAACLGVKLK